MSAQIVAGIVVLDFSADGNVLTIYDRMLGTFTPGDRAVSVVYGLDDADPARIGAFGGGPAP